MNLKKTENKKKIWFSFWTLFITGLSLSLIVPISCNTLIVDEEEKNAQTDLTKTTKLFTNEFLNQDIIFPEIFFSEGDIDEFDLEKMEIKIPENENLSFKREYKIQNIDWEKASLELKIIISNSNYKNIEPKIIKLNISWSQTSKQGKILKKIDENIVVKKNNKKLYYKNKPQNENLIIEGKDESITHEILSSSTIDENGFSKIKIKFIYGSELYPINLIKTFNVGGFDNINKNEDLLNQMNNELKNTNTIEANKYKDKIIPFGFKIPNNITTIGDSAFENAIIPLGFKIPSSVTTIGDSAFKLDYTERTNKNQQFPHDFTLANSNITTIGDSAFENRIISKNFAFPDTLKKIGDSAFEGAILPKKFIIPRSVESIGESAFKRATIFKKFKILAPIKIIKSGTFEDVKLPFGFKIPDSVTTIESFAFLKATLPPNFKIPNLITSIEESVFQEAVFSNDFEVPKNVTSIKKYAFWGANLSKGFTLLNSGVISIGDHAFEWAILPKGFTLLNSGVISIGDYAFKKATLPTGFKIPISATIGTDAFANVTLQENNKWFNKEGQEIENLKNIAGGSYVILIITSTSNAINLHTFLTDSSSNNLETFLTHFASGVLGSITLNDGHGFTTSVAYKTNGSDIKINGQAEITITIEKDGKSTTKNIILKSNDESTIKQKVVDDKMTDISVRSATSTSNAINLHTFLTDSSSNNLETFLTHFASGVLGSITLNDGHGFTTSVAYKTNGSDIKINGQTEITITIEKDGKSATKNIILNSSNKAALETAAQKVVDDKMTDISVRSATSTSNAMNLHAFLTDSSSNNLETFLTHFASGVLGSITLNDGHGFTTSVAYKTNGSDIKINGQAEITITIEKDGKSATKNIILNSSNKAALETAAQKVVDDKMTDISVRSATSTSNAINLHAFLTDSSSNNLETFLTHFASGVLGSITLNDGHGFTTSVAYKTNGSDIKINGQAEITITIEKDGKSATKNIILNSSNKAALETAAQKVVDDKMTDISVRSATSTSNAINLHAFLTDSSSNNLETFLTHFASGVLGSITLNDGHGFTTSVAYKTNGSDIKINGQAEITITIEKDGKSATKNIILNSSE